MFHFSNQPAVHPSMSISGIQGQLLEITGDFMAAHLFNSQLFSLYSSFSSSSSFNSQYLWFRMQWLDAIN